MSPTPLGIVPVLFMYKVITTGLPSYINWRCPQQTNPSFDVLWNTDYTKYLHVVVENYTPLILCHSNATPASINALDTIQDALPTTIRGFDVPFIKKVHPPEHSPSIPNQNVHNKTRSRHTVYPCTVSMTDAWQCRFDDALGRTEQAGRSAADRGCCRYHTVVT